MTVRDSGPRDARLVLVGEMAGVHEMAQGRPFVGPSGQTLDAWLAAAKLSRSSIYVTNVVPYQHNRGNRIDLVPRIELEAHVEALHARLADLVDPWVIVPTGNTALWALTGLGGAPWSRRARGRAVPGIVAHRGSIYEYGCSGHAHAVKVIPTIHPAATFRVPRWAYRCKRDWQRIAGDLAFRELRLPARDHRIRPTLAEVWDYVADATMHASCMAIDVETPRKVSLVEVKGRVKKNGDVGKSRWKKVRGVSRVTCVGFSFEAHTSMTIPLTGWGTPDEAEDARRAVAALCALDCDKVMQNGLFDAWWLTRLGAPVARYVWDPRWMSHSLDPLDDHDLGYLASLDTREPYWKSDVKGYDDPDTEEHYTSLDTFYRYNGKDACVTRELADIYRPRVGADYVTRYARYFAPLLRMMLHGIRLNVRGAAARRTRFAAQCAMIRERLREVTGVELFGTKDVSNKKLSTYLYETLKLPKQYHVVKGQGDKRRALTANEVAVRKLALSFPRQLGDVREADAAFGNGNVDDALAGMTGVAPLLLVHKRLSVQQRFLRETIAGADGRVRTQFGWVETRRLASGKAPDRSGQNLQNVDWALRDVYLADDGCVLVEVDLSQAERRYVLMLSAQFAETPARAEALRWRARARPDENDEHVRMAQSIFKVDVPTRFQREIGKRVNHAGAYGMHGKTFAENLLKDGIVMSDVECEGLLEVQRRADPEIQAWHRDVRMRAMRERALATPWGLVWDLTDERLSDDLYRSLYAMEPQNAPPEIINTWGLLPLDEAIQLGEFPGAAIQLQTHDALAVSVPPADAWNVAAFLVGHLEQPIVAGGAPLTIWATVKVGRSWGEMREWKRLPMREEFNAAVASL